MTAAPPLLSEGEALHVLAREVAAALIEPDRKHLRFNEIVETALMFYPTDPRGGVRELVESCDRQCTALYVKGRPMWAGLRASYAWMIPS